MRIKRIDHLFDTVFSILLFSLSISMAVPNILLGILLLLFIFKKKQVTVSKTYVKLLLLFVLYLLFKAVVFNNLIENIQHYKFLIILLILSYLIFNIRDITIVLKGYIFGVFFGVLISVYKIIFYFLEHKILPFGNTSEVQKLILIHRPYFGFMCFLAIVLIDFLLFKIEIKYKKVAYLFMAILIAIFLYTIVARLSLCLLCVHIIIRVLIYLRLNKTKLIITLLVLLITLIGVFNLNENIKNRFHIKNSYTETLKVLKNQEPRFVIWECALNQIKKENFNVLFGYKNRRMIQENLNDCYDKKIENVSKKKYYLKTKFNSHNQFIDIFLDGGIVGLCLFLLIFIFSFFIFRGELYALYFLFSILLFLLFEDLFHRQLGVYLFGVFMPLFYKIIILKKNEEKQNNIGN
tara:strand:- start:3183 stop:4403 length:1221 start_codon:yes stop_codon:yes gene_type:complete